MSTSQPTVYLVTGANRGIGLAVVKRLLEDKEAVVYAGVRDPSAPSELHDLATTSNGRLFTVKLRSTNLEDAQAVAREVGARHGKVDVVIANAAIMTYEVPLLTSELKPFVEHFEVNTLGPLVLYQALRAVIIASPQPRFVAITTGAASITKPAPFTSSSYLVSKAALNFLVQKIAQEESEAGLAAIVISPGWVQTDMGNRGARTMGMEQAPVTLTDSANGIVKLVQEATKETHNGKMWDYTGTTWDW